MTKLGAFLEWLKQPPTLKGLVLVAGLLGFAVDPSQVQDIILAASGLYAALALFYDNSTRRPKLPTPEELDKLLSTEEIIALVRLRRSKIRAEKAVACSNAKP